MESQIQRLGLFGATPARTAPAVYRPGGASINSKPNLTLAAPPVYRPNGTTVHSKPNLTLAAPPVYRPYGTTVRSKPNATPTAPPVYRPQPQIIARHVVGEITRPASPPVFRAPSPAPPVQRMRRGARQGSNDRKAARPAFDADGKKIAYFRHNHFSPHDFQVDVKKPDLPTYNAAIPHRMSYKDIRDNADRFLQGDDDDEGLDRWTGRLQKAGKEKIRETDEALERARESKDKALIKDLTELKKRQNNSEKKFANARDSFRENPTVASRDKFVKHANSYHPNIDGLGPQLDVNGPVGERAHLNTRPSENKKKRKRRQRSLTPTSKQVCRMSPERISKVAVDQDDNLILTSGETIDPETMLDERDRERIKDIGTHPIKAYDPNYTFG